MWRVLGITALEEHVYRALLDEPATSAEDLGISGLDYRIAVRRLAELGLVEQDGRRIAGHGADPGGVDPRAVDPRVAFDTLIRDHRGQLDRLAAEVDRLAADFQAGRLRADPTLAFEFVEGEAALSARFRELMTIVEHDIVCFDAPPYVMDSDECEALELGALDRGVQLRALYATSVLDEPAKLSYVSEMRSRGEEPRLIRSVPLKLFLFDRRTAVVPLTVNERGSRFRSVVVHRSVLTEALHALFDVLWRGATPWPTRASGSGTTEQQQILLGYLVSGMKDEAIARQLGCSRRTLQRRVDTLLDELGATSRFQAGALAARRGWL